VLTEGVWVPLERNYLLSWKRGHRHDLGLELIVPPVSDVDRAKGFCEALGFRLDADCTANEECRVVRFTPGSECSIIFGDAMTTAAPARSGACTSSSPAWSRWMWGPVDSCGYLSDRNIPLSDYSRMTDYWDGSPGPTLMVSPERERVARRIRADRRKRRPVHFGRNFRDPGIINSESKETGMSSTPGTPAIHSRSSSQGGTRGPACAYQGRVPA
jgi:hypothetical protein